MTAPDQNSGDKPGDSPLAFSVMFFAMAFLCLMLGWAQGVRKDTTFLHIPESGGWLVATGILFILGLILLIWSRTAKR
ncbi:MAG: hypothetical protein ABI233_03505 [Chthoniobacterales bacterium]